MKQEINVFDYAKEITSALHNGVLLTTKNGEKVNCMTIGWGNLGVVWEQPVFITFVREGRFTREQLDASMDFTINIPYGEYDKKSLAIAVQGQEEIWIKQQTSILRWLSPIV